MLPEESDIEQSAVPLEEIEAMRAEIARKMLEGHAWKQEGTRVYCTSCQNGHGFFVQPGVFLQGITEDGKPDLKKLF